MKDLWFLCSSPLASATKTTKTLITLESSVLRCRSFDALNYIPDLSATQIVNPGDVLNYLDAEAIRAASASKAMARAPCEASSS